ncbi:MAG TPA: LysE family translocator [Caulobacterales bacterium]|nr:LysE family translocator [Caulobacterales bacterium]
MSYLDAHFWAGFTLFAFAASVTPGPNNMMMMASGANFGLARTLPHMAGVVFGFTVLILAVGLGLGALLTAWPALHAILYWAGSAYLLWLAWRIASAGTVGAVEAGRPRNFWEIVAFQWVNPKAWTGALGAVATYAPPENYYANLAIICAIFAGVNIPVAFLWTTGGAALKGLLADARALRAFNIAMALLLVISIPPIADGEAKLWQSLLAAR